MARPRKWLFYQIFDYIVAAYDKKNHQFYFFPRPTDISEAEREEAKRAEAKRAEEEQKWDA